MFNGPFKPGLTTAPQADELNRLHSKVRALDGITTVPPLTIQRGPDGRPIIAGGASGGGGSDGGFWAALLTKAAGDCPTYTFAEVEEDGEPTAWVEVSGGRTGTCYEVNCVDLPAAALADGSMVVRLHQDADGDYYFESPPRWEFVKVTGAESGGFYPGVRVYFDGDTPTDGPAVQILDLNT